MEVEIPNSAKFKKPNILPKVLVSPIKSSPKLLRNIFRDTKDMINVRK